MTSPQITTTTYEATRLAIASRTPFTDLIDRFEAAVPPVTPALVDGADDWAQVEARTTPAATNGFLIYARLDPGATMRIAGNGRDDRRSAVYLMGNHLIAETMYRHHPGVMLYAPLRVEIHEDADGSGIFSIDRPGAAFASFGHPDIAHTGHLLDSKLATLLTVLGLPVPAQLSAR